MSTPVAAHPWLLSEPGEAPSASPTDEQIAIKALRKRAAGTKWRFKHIRLSLHDDGSAGYFFKGGKWVVAAPDQVKVFDKTGRHRVTLTVDKTLEAGSVVWADGTKQKATRFK